MRFLIFLLGGGLFLPTPSAACSVALLLMIDVSQSVDAGEYSLQVEGLARALEEPQIRENLLDGEIALAVMQWSGVGAQTLSLPWAQMRSTGDIDVFAGRVRAMQRAYLTSNTALRDAVHAGLGLMGSAPHCARRVIDISGDGPENAGGNPRLSRQAAQLARVTVNALAIESLGQSLTRYFRSTVITRDGFVITARGYRDYGRAISLKIARETAQIMF